MENFVYEYPTKVYFGKGAVGQHLPGILAGYGPNVLLAYGGGSVIDCCKIVAAQAVRRPPRHPFLWARWLPPRAPGRR